ncbi:hypothetical protein H112_06783 [Trichophyton rubrum D6]|uniref:Glutamine synthetase n=3 Tax=Trichophyton rubrum TaxID=5551 RepID=A0A178F078_TRIRU|nr:uncharacterized protein TERG_02133 [Trichophyton rubrum CBS 118892]EZF12160.1 hypothetical protein H100_06805 [Trichophyton rubrum MR850]EZF39017.1 hypothetical protein H102_06766 [Trichophyton rubrum CBS 100081]EZF49733.1 hypothetical protein H103_06791 [Trichophyton rubrum CBS 288.86]EZF60295.1 hypothetical protein H104_06745 [Trichophyton rubrum CBS 289.86]EZF81665.1 hypothetical protein H110_06787 [Trichophyton rubrum MR1448]EZF92233.1 hypothetical protein H113_06838 [Trichophyton rubr
MAPHANRAKVDDAKANSMAGTEGSNALHALLTLYPSICFLRCQWQDYSGVVRARIVPMEQAQAIAAEKRRLHVPACAFHLTVSHENIPEMDPRGYHWLIPDWDSLYPASQQLGVDPSYASVMCGVVEHLPIRPELNWNYCPRKALKTVVEKAEKLLHVHFLVDFEVEFQVMKAAADGKIGPHSSGLGRCAISGLRDPCVAHIQEVVHILIKAGVGVGAFQTEGDRGQYEIALEPQSPLRAIDELIFVHDTLKSVFARHGLIATMAPRPVASHKQVAGQHTHISLNPPNKETSFLAGILRRLPGLCAFFLPYDLSYERVQPYLAGHIVAWGSENRAVPVRQIKSGHWELRCVDATANMYVALAAVISAGTIGCINEEPLVWPDTGLITEHFPTSGVEPFPKSVAGSLEQLEKCCDSLQEFMESRILRHYIAVKRYEAPRLQTLPEETVRQLLCEIF